LPEDLAPLLSLLGHHVNKSAALFARLCRVLDAHLALVAPQLTRSGGSGGGGGANTAGSRAEVGPSKEDEAAAEERARPAMRLLATCLLPALTTGPSTPAFACQVWAVLGKLPFHLRYSLYDSWRGEAVGKEAAASGAKPPLLALAETHVLHGTKYQLKRLAKENAKKVGAQLAQLAHRCPLVVWAQVLGHLQHLG
jgi:hypothetical protein